MDREAWRATVHWVGKSLTQPKQQYARMHPMGITNHWFQGDQITNSQFS